MPRHFDLLIRGGTVMLPWATLACDIGATDGRITAIGAESAASADTIIDAAGLHVLPGLIDPHVHLRDPGDATVESIPTGTRAAILGGIATVFDMPNTQPAITTAETLAWKQNYVPDHSFCDLGIYVGATRANTPDLASLEHAQGVCAIKLFAGSSTGDLMIEDDAGIEAVMRAGRRRVAFHSEDEYRLQARRRLFHSGEPYAKHMEWRDEECAFLGTRRIIAMAERTGRPAHIVHVSTEEEFDYLRDHRAIATAEVLVNHLTQIGPECYEQLGAYAVMNPPIRDRRHFEAAWRAVQDGRVDTIGSDHAPHSHAAKARPWPDTAAGLTGVQTAVPVMLNHVHEGRLSLARMVDLMAAGPARVYGAVTKGRIAAGFDADFTLVDMNHARTIENDWIATPAGWTALRGNACDGLADDDDRARPDRDAGRRGDRRPKGSAGGVPLMDTPAHHDMGGLPRFLCEPIATETHALTEFDRTVDAIRGLLGAKAIMSVDELRAGIEAIPAAEYDALTYYQRWLRSMVATLLERGVITEAELAAALR